MSATRRARRSSRTGAVRRASVDQHRDDDDASERARSPAGAAGATANAPRRRSPQRRPQPTPAHAADDAAARRDPRDARASSRAGERGDDRGERRQRRPRRRQPESSATSDGGRSTAALSDARHRALSLADAPTASAPMRAVAALALLVVERWPRAGAGARKSGHSASVTQISA